MRRIEGFHNHVLLWMCIVIVVFVLALLLWIMVRYNDKANPTPSTFSHNTLLEVLWTGRTSHHSRRHRHSFVPPSARRRDSAEADRHDDQSDGGSQVVLGITSIPTAATSTFTSKMLPKEQAEAARKAVPSGGKRTALRTCQQNDPHDHHRRRRDPLVDRSRLRREARRNSRPPQRDLLPSREDGRVLRSVLGTLRRRPCLHADRSTCRHPRGIRPGGRTP